MVRNKGKIVFTNGCFDIVHVGHLEMLAEAKSKGDYLIVGLNSDSSVKRLKGSERPINNEADRKFFLENIRHVDEVIIFHEDTPLDLIKKLAPDVLVKGGDWPTESIVGSDVVLAKGGQVLSLNFKSGYSTSKIISEARKTE